MNDFARLLEAEIPRLRRYARALTRDVARADDLVQSCLTRAVAKQHLWQPGTDLRAWLFTILHNQHVNDVRRSVREGINVAVEEMAPMLTVQSNAVAVLQLRDLEAVKSCNFSPAPESRGLRTDRFVNGLLSNPGLSIDRMLPAPYFPAGQQSP